MKYTIFLILLVAIASGCGQKKLGTNVMQAATTAYVQVSIDSGRVNTTGAPSQPQPFRITAGGAGANEVVLAKRYLDCIKPLSKGWKFGFNRNTGLYVLKWPGTDEGYLGAEGDPDKNPDCIGFCDWGMLATVIETKDTCKLKKYLQGYLDHMARRNYETVKPEYK